MHRRGPAWRRSPSPSRRGRKSTGDSWRATTEKHIYRPDEFMPTPRDLGAQAFRECENWHNLEVLECGRVYEHVWQEERAGGANGCSVYLAADRASRLCSLGRNENSRAVYGCGLRGNPGSDRGAVLLPAARDRGTVEAWHPSHSRVCSARAAAVQSSRSCRAGHSTMSFCRPRPGARSTPPWRR
jgi:hypothetical protein